MALNAIQVYSAYVWPCTLKTWRPLRDYSRRCGLWLFNAPLSAVVRRQWKNTFFFLPKLYFFFAYFEQVCIDICILFKWTIIYGPVYLNTFSLHEFQQNKWNLQSRNYLNKHFFDTNIDFDKKWFVSHKGDRVASSYLRLHITYLW